MGSERSFELDKKLIEAALTQADNTKQAIFAIEKQIKQGLSPTDTTNLLKTAAEVEYRYTLMKINLNRIIDKLEADAFIKSKG